MTFHSMSLSRSARTVAVAVIMACVVPLSDASARTVVVVNVHNPVASMTPGQLADIFLARVTTYPNGADAVPIDQRDRSETRDAFYRAISGKSPAQLKTYWSTLIFTGRGEPPRAVSDAEAVKKALADVPTAVGYIDESAVDSSVKVVLVLP